MPPRDGGGPHGLAVVDKPPGRTSHDVVAGARRLLGTRRVGHAGTLDPDATGVLLLGVGVVTRLLRFLSDLPKVYEGEVVLGVATTTLDAAGDVTATWDMGGVTPAEVAHAAARFVGEIEQVPPMVSAVKVGGRRLHQLAREGKEVERRARRVTVHRLATEPAPGQPGVYRLQVTCSSGTYVRTLAADLGAALGGGAHLRRLRRTAVGPFTVERARPVDDLQLLPPLEALPHLPRVEVDPSVAAAVAHGRPLPADQVDMSGPGPWALVADGRLLAVYEPARGRAKPAVVLASG